jgi:TusA-related sulfurtransferase
VLIILTDEKIKFSLDATGIYCPEPLFQTRTSLDDEIEIGEILEVLADDPAAEEDIKRLVKRTGHELINFENNDGVFRFLIKKIK